MARKIASALAPPHDHSNSLVPRPNRSNLDPLSRLPGDCRHALKMEAGTVGSRPHKSLSTPSEVQAMKIRWKIDLAISGAFLVGLGLAGVGAYTILSKNALEESLQNARIMIEGAWAIRSYTVESKRTLSE